MEILNNEKIVFNHETKMAVFLLEGVEENDLEAIKQTAYSCQDKRFLNDGYILYIGVDNRREDWKEFSDSFWSLVIWCELNDYEWLRFCP